MYDSSRRKKRDKKGSLKHKGTGKRPKRKKQNDKGKATRG